MAYQPHKKKKEGARPSGEESGEIDLGLGGFLGGIFKGIEKIVELAQKAEEAGGELRKVRTFGGKTETRKPWQGVYGFSIKTGLGKAGTRVETFGNIKKTPKGPQIVKTREPLVDVFDEKDHILVIAELPGVAEGDIKLELRGDILSLETTGERKYAKEILLPAKVDSLSKQKSFKNGILEVKFKKVS